MKNCDLCEDMSNSKNTHRVLLIIYIYIEISRNCVRWQTCYFIFGQLKFRVELSLSIGIIEDYNLCDTVHGRKCQLLKEKKNPKRKSSDEISRANQNTNSLKINNNVINNKR